MGLDRLKNRRNQGTANNVAQEKVYQEEPRYIPEKDIIGNVQQTTRTQHFDERVENPSYRQGDAQRVMVEEPVYRDRQPVYQDRQSQQPVYQDRQQSQQNRQVVHQEPVYRERRVGYDEPVYEERGRQLNYREPRQEQRQNNTFSTSREIEEGSISYPDSYSISLAIPDQQALQILGITNPDNVRIMQLEPMKVKPLILDNIRDLTGYVSDKLLRFKDKYGITVIPLKEAGVFENITEVKDFDIVRYKGKAYASYSGNDYSTTTLNSVLSTITDKLLTARPYGLRENPDNPETLTVNKDEAILTKKVNINGIEVEVPLLCATELRYLVAYFEYCHPAVFSIKDSFPIITVGHPFYGNTVN